jgi:hypothetical protein
MAMALHSTKQLVASRGRVGSNPTPGAVNIVLNEPHSVGYFGFLKIFAFPKSETYSNLPSISSRVLPSVGTILET